MSTLMIPVMNGILPRPGGGTVVGAFLDGVPGQAPNLESGDPVFICPLVPSSGSLYRIGVLGKIVDIRRQMVEIAGSEPVPFLSLVIEGGIHARWKSLSVQRGFLMAEGLEPQDFRQMRDSYAVVSGAGWAPQGGYTEFRSLGDIPVTLYGTDIESNSSVSMTANLKGLVSLEAAHTIEHAMIRALRTYGLCTARTLQEAMREEALELTWSVEKSMRYSLPDVLGHTQAGVCGNPMTNMAQFFLFEELTEVMKGQGDGQDALFKARRTVMSRLTGELALTTEPGLRAQQGLKKGMKHDDSPLSMELCKKIIGRFPLDPWQ